MGRLRSPGSERHSQLPIRPHIARIPVAAAQRNVTLLTADGDLIALLQNVPFPIQPHHHRRLAPAPADGANFAQRVGDGQQSGGARKELALKVRPQAETHDRHAEPVRRTGELPDLALRKELRFVHQNAGERAVLKRRLDALVEIVPRLEGLRLGLQPDARADRAEPSAMVQPCARRSAIRTCKAPAKSKSPSIQPSKVSENSTSATMPCTASNTPSEGASASVANTPSEARKATTSMPMAEGSFRKR